MEEMKKELEEMLRSESLSFQKIAKTNLNNIKVAVSADCESGMISFSTTNKVKVAIELIINPFPCEPTKIIHVGKATTSDIRFAAKLARA